MQKVKALAFIKKQRTKNQKIKISCGAAIIVIGLFLAGITLYQMFEPTDPISVQTMIDTQEGVINQTEHIVLPDRVKTETEYTIHVTYAIIDKATEGKTIFTTDKKPSDNMAYVADYLLETTQTCYPAKPRVSIHLNMISSAKSITNKDGEAIDITKQQLVPIITIEKAEE